MFIRQALVPGFKDWEANRWSPGERKFWSLQGCKLAWPYSNTLCLLSSFSPSHLQAKQWYFVLSGTWLLNNNLVCSQKWILKQKSSSYRWKLFYKLTETACSLKSFQYVCIQRTVTAKQHLAGQKDKAEEITKCTDSKLPRHAVKMEHVVKIGANLSHVSDKGGKKKQNTTVQVLPTEKLLKNVWIYCKSDNDVSHGGVP